MKTATKAAVLTGAAAAVAVGQRVAHHRARGHDREERWLAVTVNRSPDQVGAPDTLPEPLARLRDRIEVRIRRATGDKGTDLLARPAAGSDVSRGDLRVALRQAKSLIETGMVLQPDTPPSTHPGPAGKVLQLITRKSMGGGRL